MKITVMQKLQNFQKINNIAQSNFVKSLFVFCLLLVGALSVFFVSPNIADAQGANFSFFKTPGECNLTECGWPQLVKLANEVIDFAVYIAIIGATLAFAFAGFKMLFNAGSSGEIEKAKKMMWTATIGIVITLSAWLIVDFILTNLGVGGEFRTLIP